ncbi:MAG: choice-of-anchor Q domain-containing protein [Pseudomonadota bacterium]
MNARFVVAGLIGLLVLIPMSSALQAAVFSVAAGDASGLVAALNAANANSESDLIKLSGGTYSFYNADNATAGNNALPAITTEVVIEGNAATLQRVELPPFPKFFRFFYVAPGGSLTLKSLHLTKGALSGDSEGDPANIAKRGTSIASLGKLVLEEVEISHSYNAVPVDSPHTDDAFQEGAVYASGDELLTIEDSLLRDNGAAVTVIDTGARVFGTQFLNNDTALSFFAHNGIYEISVDGSQFASNGRALLGSSDGLVRVTQSQFTDNGNRPPNTDTWPVVGVCARPLVLDSIGFTGNAGPGVINGFYGCSGPTGTGTMIVENSTFAANDIRYDLKPLIEPGDRSPVLENRFGFLQVVNTTISGNTGVAVLNQDPQPTDGKIAVTAIRHATIVNNAEPLAAVTGLHNRGQGIVQLSNTIIARSGVSLDCLDQGNVVINNGSLIEDGTCATGLATDPLLCPLADNGGETATHLPATASPVVDAADPVYCLDTDQRGALRPYGDGCDIGSVEQQPSDALVFGEIDLPIWTHPEPFIFLCDPVPAALTTYMLGTRHLPIQDIDPSSLELGNAGFAADLNHANRPVDVNADGLLDLPVHWSFEAALGERACIGTNHFLLSGQTRSGERFATILPVYQVSEQPAER